MEVEHETPAKWQDELYDLLRRNRITQFAYVPDAGHRILIDRSLADPGVHSVALTSEEEGMALLAGADLGGARGVLLMQSSGVGNGDNMLSLVKGGRLAQHGSIRLPQPFPQRAARAKLKSSDYNANAANLAPRPAARLE